MACAELRGSRTARCSTCVGIRDGFGEIGRLDHRTLYYQTIHGKTIAGGFVARLPGPLTERLQASPFVRVLLQLSEGGAVEPGLRDTGLAAARATLRERGVRYLVLDTRATSPDLQDFIRALGLRSAFVADGRELFVVDP
jgi:hypothetical protein